MLKKFAPLLILLAVFVGSTLLLTPPQQNQTAYGASQQEPADNEPWWSTASPWEAIFTGIIALLSVGQYFASQKSDERQLRAYVSVIASGFDGTRTGKRGGPAFQLAFRNAGQTPANNLRFWSGVKFGDAPLTIDLPPHPDPSSGRTTLGPQCESFGHGSKADVLTPTELADMKAERGAVYFFGCINYDDVFGNPRETNFRLIFRGDMTGPLEKHEDGNQAT